MFKFLAHINLMKAESNVCTSYTLDKYSSNASTLHKTKFEDMLD